MFVNGCINPFIVLAFGILGFFSWIFVVKTSQIVFPKIKKHDAELYKKIIIQDTKGWLERGWYSPTDIDVQIRLYRAIYRGDANQLLSHRSWRGYVWSVRICIVAFVMALIGAVTVFICYASIRGK